MAEETTDGETASGRLVATVGRGGGGPSARPPARPSVLVPVPVRRQDLLIELQQLSTITLILFY
jgi:hypothetical protein